MKWYKDIGTRSIAYFIIGLFMMSVLLSLCSCITQYVPVETIRTEYKTKTDTFIQKDSVYVKDFVFVKQKGDTVWIERWKTKYAVTESQRTIRDTIIKTDSVQVPYPVERKLTKWEQFKVDYFIYILLIVFVFFLLYCVYLARRKIGSRS